MEDLAGRADAERGCFFLMERTQAFQVLAGLGEADMLADNFGDIHPIPDLTDEFDRNLASRHSDPRSSRARLSPPTGGQSKPIEGNE